MCVDVAGYEYKTRPELRAAACYCTITRSSLFPLLAMALSRRPTRSRARKVASAVSFLCLAFVAILCLAPGAVRADELDDKRAEYGTVIGIGMSSLLH